MLLEIKDLHGSTIGLDNQNGVEILKGLSLKVKPGEIHALMGPNGSGKSTLANILLGSPEYEATSGEIKFKGESIVNWSADARGKAGLFLAFQYPQEISGVSVLNFLRQALSARKEMELSVLELRLALMEWIGKLGIDESFLDRYVNEGFSGGEKKRNEILQMAILQPKLAVLDETDSGLDIDALRVVSDGVNKLRNENNALILITHYQRLLEYIEPDHVHVLNQGLIVKSGDKNLALELEAQGYDWLTPAN